MGGAGLGGAGLGSGVGFFVDFGGFGTGPVVELGLEYAGPVYSGMPYTGLG